MGQIYNLSPLSTCGAYGACNFIDIKDITEFKNNSEDFSSKGTIMATDR